MAKDDPNVKEIVLENINSLQQRGEKIEDIQKNATELEIQGQELNNNARDLVRRISPEEKSESHYNQTWCQILCSCCCSCDDSDEDYEREYERTITHSSSTSTE